MKKLIILLALCCAMLFFTSCVSRPTLPVPEKTPSLEPSPNMDDLDALTLNAEEGEVLPDSLLLAPVELSQVLEGNLTGYVRLRVDGWVFEWVQSDVWEQWVLISQETVEGLVFQSSFDVRSSGAPGEFGRRFALADVNFDGKPDLLFCLGHFGNQGALAYACFLQRENGFEACASFSDIPNPAIDEENQLILSSWRNSASSHGWGMYAYEDGIFRCVERLTMQPKPDSTMDKSDYIWQYVEETWVDRAWITEVWNCDEHTEEETQARYNEEGGLWALSAGRWTDWI